MPYALVHYHELALKGRNRKYFEQKLIHHLQSSLRGIDVVQVESLPGRIRVDFQNELKWKDIGNRLKQTFGIANFCFARAVPIDIATPNISPLLEAVGKAVSSLDFTTFRVTTKRAEKRFPKTSLDIDREVGAFICDRTGKRVSLSKPELTIHIELLTHEAYFSLSREQGPGGLPTGISGRVISLISGGIDSPVAAYRMMKRGCTIVFIHFHGRPYLSRASEEKVRELVQQLTSYQLYSRLYLVPFGEIQRQVVLESPPPLRVVLYRRLMVRIAQELAAKERCWALITGDSLGQVASQTPENLKVIDEVSNLPILRPLIGMDKIEITQQAQALGTFETSIEPDQDCCRLFVPAHPATRSRLDVVRKAERRFDTSSLVKLGLEGAELVEMRSSVA